MKQQDGPPAESVVLEHLRAIRATQDRRGDDLREIKGRLGMLEPQYASLSNRLDRLVDRVAHTERRLERRDA